MSSGANDVVRNGRTFTRTREIRLLEEFEDYNAAGDATSNQMSSTRVRSKKRKAAPQNLIALKGVMEVGNGEIIGDGSESHNGTNTGSVNCEEELQQDQNHAPMSHTSLLQDHMRELMFLATRKFHKPNGNYLRSSYAAAVSGRNSQDLKGISGDMMTDKDIVEQELRPESTDKVSSKDLDRCKPIVPKTIHEVAKKDVGIQVPEIGMDSGDKSLREVKTRNRSTMTTSKGRCKNKSVSAKLCCEDEDKRNPVEFHGKHFTFERTLAKAVAQTGITFMDCCEELESLLHL